MPTVPHIVATGGPGGGVHTIPAYDDAASGGTSPHATSAVLGTVRGGDAITNAQVRVGVPSGGGVNRARSVRWTIKNSDFLNKGASTTYGSSSICRRILAVPM